MAFGPELYYDRFDNVRGEPKWAAMLSSEFTVRVFYALAYYRDLGPVVDVCLQVGDDWFDCFPHWGDSEVIVLDVTYDFETDHWVLSELHLSRHTSTDHYGASSFTYTDKLFGYPRIFVSRQKHANYRNDEDCDNGEPDGIPFPLSLIVQKRTALRRFQGS